MIRKAHSFLFLTVLAGTASAASGPPLDAIRALEDDDAEIRQKAFDEILDRGIHDPDSVLPHLPTAGSAHLVLTCGFLRERIAKERKRITEERNRQALLDAAGADETLRQAFEALLEHRDHDGEHPFWTILSRNPDPERVSSALWPYLSGEDEKLRVLACGLLGRMNACGTGPALTARLKETRDPRTIRALIEALGSVGDPAQAPAIVPYLDYVSPKLNPFDAGEWVPLAAIQTLGRLKHAASAGRIARFLETHSDPMHREAAFQALESIGDLSVAPRIAAWAEGKRPAERIPACLTLVRIGRKEYAHQIASYLHHPNGSVRIAAAVALKKLAGEAWEDKTKPHPEGGVLLAKATAWWEAHKQEFTTCPEDR